jgi:hypothetical protein
MAFIAFEHISGEALARTSAAEITGTPSGKIHAASGNAAERDGASLLIACAFFGQDRLAAQHTINGIGDVEMDDDFFPALLFDDDIEGRRSFAL